MLDLTDKDFQRVRSVLVELVRASKFFPTAVKDDDWFRPHEENTIRAAGARTATAEKTDMNNNFKEKRHIRTHSEDGRRLSLSFARRPRGHSLNSVESSSSSTETSFESSSSSSSSLSSSCACTRRNNGEPSSITSTEVAVDVVTSIPAEEVEPGTILGSGGFCEVRLATLRCCNNHVNCARAKQCYAMKYLILPDEHAHSDHAKVAMDPARKQANKNKRFFRGIADLAIEARFLALLSHKNIISLHYVSQGSFEERYSGRNRFGYFLLLDPMVETLSQRIDSTYIPHVLKNFPVRGIVATMKSLRHKFPLNGPKHNNHAFADISTDRNRKLNVWRMELSQRLAVVTCVASALQYMHDVCNVVCRDLKPDNIGFYRKPHPECRCGKRFSKYTQDECTCYDDIPKLFDFGLCKELKPEYLKAHPHHGPHDKIDTYKLTARSGSRRYMAPEVAHSQPYSEKADVYSFGILLYQIASLLTPFEGYSFVQHEDEVLLRGHRPNVDIPSYTRANSLSYPQWFAHKNTIKTRDLLEFRTKCVWTEPLKQLIEECWQTDMRFRPSMRDVVVRLEECLRELTKHIG